MDALRSTRGDVSLAHAPVCKPDRNLWLNSVGLKSSPRGLIPLDDESDGVLVNGFFYPNPKKPRRPGQMYDATRKATRGRG